MPAPTTSASAPPRRGACTGSQLAVAAVRGGASQGTEFAGLVFTNISRSACTMRGYPSAQLRRQGRTLGRPAAHAAGTVRTVRLRPGRSAQAQLSAVSTCQSPLSDQVRVVAPGVTSVRDVAVQLRACRLAVGPVDAA